MNSLRDKLLKAGLVTEEEARRAEAKERLEKKKQVTRAPRGGGGMARGGRPQPRAGARVEAPPKEQRLSPEELARAEAKRKEQDRRKALELERLENRRRAAEQLAKAEDVRRVAEHLGMDVSGEEVFHFMTRKKKLQRMLVSAAAVADLESGRLAVIEHPLPHALEFAVVPREGAEAVLKIEPRAVRFYNRSETERFGFAD